jgi:CheY-like chemotaxis protein
VKFTKSGGVVFSVQRVPSTRKNSDPAVGDGIRFSVSDTGIGISEADVAKLFEPFTQVGNKATAAATGTGLGLAISRSLVERMGGKLNVESKPGWGSRFWFDITLPVVNAATTVVAGTTKRIVGYEGKRRRVLVVDDNSANRAVMVDMLAPIGFDVAEAEDGPESLVRAENFAPDLVLMDLRMPGEIDGLEATRRLRAMPRGDALRIVAVSASAYDVDRNECLTAGCNEFLAKPFREEELWAVVQRMLAVTWKHADTEDTRSPFAAPIQPPPEAEAKAIYDLATKGDVVAIRARAQALIALDPKYATFAQSVLELAARFKMKAIRQFVARFMP